MTDNSFYKETVISDYPDDGLIRDCIADVINAAITFGKFYCDVKETAHVKKVKNPLSFTPAVHIFITVRTHVLHISHSASFVDSLWGIIKSKLAI